MQASKVLSCTSLTWPPWPNWAAGSAFATWMLHRSASAHPSGNRRHGGQAARADSGLQEERQRIQRGLRIVRFPPGSLTHGVDPATLETYWQTACPNAAAAGVAMTVTITLHVLDRARGAASSNRAELVDDHPLRRRPPLRCYRCRQGRAQLLRLPAAHVHGGRVPASRHGRAPPSPNGRCLVPGAGRSSDAQSALKTPSVGLTADSKPTIPELGPTIDRVSSKPPEVRKPGLASQRHTRGGPANRASARSH